MSLDVTLRIRASDALRRKLEKLARKEDYRTVSDLVRFKLRDIVAAYEKENPGVFDDLSSADELKDELQKKHDHERSGRSPSHAKKPRGLRGPTN